MAEPTVNYLAVGHLAKDLTPAGPQLGGTVAYAALTARELDYSPGIVTACDVELDLSRLGGMPVECLPSPFSTTFENIYGPSGRTQFIRGQAVPLGAGAVPPAWLRAPVLHLAPLAREIDGAAAIALAGAFDGAVIGMTPQGWLREWDGEGRVRQSLSAWPEALDVLRHAHAAVLSIVDIAGDWAVAEQWAKAAPILVVTEGPDGCTVFARGHGTRQFRAPQVVEVDPTGAGDVFAAAFFINYYETEDPWASAKLANHVAALSVTRPGLEGVPTREEVGLCRTQAALS